jgi:hypothetical protein
MELQLQIIRETLKRQIVVIQFSHHRPFIARCITHVSIALHINHASREEALKHYELLKYNDPTTSDHDKWPSVYMNLATDSIEFSPQRPEDEKPDFYNSLSGYRIGYRMLSKSGFLERVVEEQRKRVAVILRGLAVYEAEIIMIFYDPYCYGEGGLGYTRELIFVLDERISKSKHDANAQRLVAHYERNKEAQVKKYAHDRVRAVGYIEQGVGYAVNSVGNLVTERQIVLERASEESVPEKSVPEESVPEESVPEESVPEESVLEESVLSRKRGRGYNM